jgi:uncharacterized membrane protein
VTYHERSALPPDATVNVRLSDVSRMDAPAPVVAETTFASAGKQVPLSFALSYNPSRVEPNHTYAVHAVIRSAGRMIFTTDRAYPVITGGNPTRVDLTLVALPDDPGGPATGMAPGSAFRVPPSQSGILAAAGDRLRFVACGQEGDGVPLDDLAGGEGQALVRELGGSGRVIVMVRIEGTRLADIRYAGGEGPGCDRLPPEGDVEAQGTEPFWHLQVNGQRATVTTPETPEGTVYDGGRWLQPDGTSRRYEARREENGRAVTLTLELTEERCADAMSGARFPFKALVRTGESQVTGCALEGRNAFHAAPDQ